MQIKADSGGGHYDGVTAYEPRDMFKDTWAGRTFGGDGNYNFAETLSANQNLFRDYNVPKQNYILDPSVQEGLFGEQPDTFNWLDGVLNSEGGYDSSWWENNFNKEEDFINTDFFDPALGYTNEEAAMLEDITSINPNEKNYLDDYGLISYNDDGTVNALDTNEAIAKLTEAANNTDLSAYERKEILDLAGQLSAAADADLDRFDLTTPDESYGVYDTQYIEDYSTPDLPIGAYPYETMGGTVYADPTSPEYIPQGAYVAGPNGKVPFLGSMASNYLGSVGANGYVSDPATNGGYVFPQQTQTMGQAMNYQTPEGFVSQNPLTAGDLARSPMLSKIAADKYGTNSRGEPNQMIPGQRYTPQPTMASRVDDFTDGVRNIGGMLLKPLNWTTDLIGGGLSSVGQMVGDNKIGNGILNFGNLVDGTGDYLFGDSNKTSLLGNVLSMPDSLARVGQGLAYGDMDMAKSSALGLLGAPLNILGNLASPLVSGLVDVAGIDELRLSVGGKGGSGNRGQRKGSSSTKARKSIPIRNTGKIDKGSNSSKSNIPTGKGSGGSISEGGSQYDLTESDGRDSYAEEFGEDALARRLKDLNIVGGGSGLGQNTPAFKSSDADKSNLVSSIAQNQGNPSGVRRAASPKVYDHIDTIAGAGPQVDQDSASSNVAFQGEREDIFKEPEETAEFEYKKGDKAFA